ncbi:MAG: HAD-IIB family hydrolase [Deinococcota bacterium]
MDTSSLQDGVTTTDNTQQLTDGLYIQLFSIHGLIRAHNLELGRDADTGGQTKYMIELAQALGDDPRVAQVDLFTRLIDDKRVSDDYAQPIETINERARIVRIPCGGKTYKRKELLWDSLDEFVDKTLRFIRSEKLSPDVVHGHYADGGYVAAELAGFLGAPLVFTGHSLGRNKVQVLEENAGLSYNDINKHYHIERRVAVEEDILRNADMVIASTNHEVAKGYELYESHKSAHYKVIPPGVNIDKFYPYYHDDEPRERSEAVMQARVKMRDEINRFLNNPNKPIILAVSRPDKRKNIGGLVTAYGLDKELQSIANLAIFAGVRKDIQDMDDNERDVLTELLLLMDKYDLYGNLALPKKHDPSTEIPALYRLAASTGGVFINPALVENFGITIIEASSSGLPVVSTDHGGPQDIIANCQSGILINSRDAEDIQQALKKILTDKELWREYSNNGVNGVRDHYAWEAHADSYLRAISAILDEADSSSVKRAPRSGQKLIQDDYLLISDVDDTLISSDVMGNPQENDDVTRGLDELRELLSHRGNLGFGLATGRSLELVKDVLASHNLPQPDVVISSVGSEIYYGERLRPDHGYAKHISYQWKPHKIRRVLAELDFLEPQEENTQRPYKISYYLEDVHGRLDYVRSQLAEAKLRHTLIYSRGQFLDILPQRASKGKAIRYLSYKWSIDPKHIAVAGDSGNDEEMLRGRFRGIVVGNYSEELEGLRGQRAVYFANATYVQGILEGLRHYKFID